MGYTALIPIMLICVLANHMGLISAIERQTATRLPIIRCCKCSTFWFAIIYLFVTGHNAIVSLALSFSAAYFAVWLELLFGIIDRQYDNLFNRFFKNTEADGSHTEDTTSA